MTFILLFQTVMGHNEDGALIANTTSYIIDAEVTPDDSNETEKFIAFCYAGQLCSTAFGYSETAGKVFSANALFPKTLDTRFEGTLMLDVCLRLFMSLPARTKHKSCSHFFLQAEISSTED
jgi:hypothetical protein